MCSEDSTVGAGSDDEAGGDGRASSEIIGTFSRVLRSDERQKEIGHRLKTGEGFLKSKRRR